MLFLMFIQIKQEVILPGMQIMQEQMKKIVLQYVLTTFYMN